MKWLLESLPAIIVLSCGILFIAYMEGWQTAGLFVAIMLFVYGMAFGTVFLAAGIIEAAFVRRHIRSLAHPFIRSEPSDNPYQSPSSF